MHGLFLFCRQGYEKDCAAEIQHQAESAGIYGYCNSKPDSAYVIYHCHNQTVIEQLYLNVRLEQLVYTRQWFVIQNHLAQLPAQDRLGDIVKNIKALALEYSQTLWEVPDSEALKPINRLTKSLSEIVRSKYLFDDFINNDADYRLHVCFTGSTECYLGYSTDNNDSRHAGGVLRLKLPREAPSRSFLKLDEALNVFIPQRRAADIFKTGTRAVDLGAAPGGWSWFLAQHKVQVSAIDNGPLNQNLLQTGLVRHLRTDAFAYIPQSPVNWLVSDIADKPMRVLALVEKWLSNDWTDNCIVILKLPMNKRYAFIKENILPKLKALRTGLPSKLIFCKHLYYNRDEICIGIIDESHYLRKR